MARGQRQRLAGYLRVFCTRTRKREIFFSFFYLPVISCLIVMRCATHTHARARGAGFERQLTVLLHEPPCWHFLTISGRYSRSFRFPGLRQKSFSPFFLGGFAICTPAWIRVWGGAWPRTLTGFGNTVKVFEKTNGKIDKSWDGGMSHSDKNSQNFF